MTEHDEHRYVLLASSAGDAVWSDPGIPTLEILATICARARALDRRTTHVIFGGSYDVNCWLKDLSSRALARVWSGAWVYLADFRYKIQYRPRRSFVIHELTTGTRVTIWDVWGFFQGSFVGALEKYGLDVPDRLRAMKLARGTFTHRQRAKIIAYCQEECALLVQLMGLVREHLTTANLPIRRWDGAGACAAALLMREGTKTHQGPAPDAVRLAAQHAYAGGRIEMIRYGHAPAVPLAHYDIVSAYPAALRHLPSLAKGHWEKYEGELSELPPFALHKLGWYFTRSNSRAYPYFWRAPNGAIFYPPMGAGWYWTPEVQAARAALHSGALIGRQEIRETWAWVPDDPEARPFAFIDPLFMQRAQWKRDGIGAEKMLKLALNSLYGKCAQHVGGKDGEPPRYHQLEWAGWITSTTRAALFRALCEAGPEAVMVATDGIFSTAALPSLAVSKNLGGWEYHCHKGATVVQSGVYWLDDETEAGEVTTSEFSRGFDKGTLDRRKIVAAWKRKQLSWDASLTRFVTMGAVVNRHSKPADWRQWRKMPRVLALTPTGTKRANAIDVEDWNKKSGAHPAYGYIPTVPTVPAALLAGSDFSSAYPLPWVPDSIIIEDPATVAARFFEWEVMEE